MKNTIYLFLFFLFTTSFIEKTQTITVELKNGLSIEYETDQINKIDYSMGMGYEKTWLYYFLLNPNGDLFDNDNDDEWYKYIYETCIPDEFCIVEKSWAHVNTRWEEIEYFYNNDGSMESILNVYTLDSCEFIAIDITPIRKEDGIKVYDWSEFQQWRLIKNGEYTGVKIRIDKGFPYAPKIRLVYEAADLNVVAYNFIGWNDSYFSTYTRYNKIEVFEDGHAEKVFINENPKMEDWEDLLQECDNSRENPPAYHNNLGELRTQFWGTLEGKHGRVPFIDHRERVPDWVKVVKINGGYTSSRIIYEHPHYDELVKDAVLAPQASE